MTSLSRQSSTLNQHAKVDAKRIEKLVQTLGRYRPSNCSEIQFYNFVREDCIIHSCSLEEAIGRCQLAWRKCLMSQRRLYASERLALLPIPIPFNLIFEALRDERLTLAKGDGLRYVVLAYKPYPTPSSSKPSIKHKYKKIRSKIPKKASKAHEKNPYSIGELRIELNYFTGNRKKMKQHKKRKTSSNKYSAIAVGNATAKHAPTSVHSVVAKRRSRRPSKSSMSGAVKMPLSPNVRKSSQGKRKCLPIGTGHGYGNGGDVAGNGVLMGDVGGGAKLKRHIRKNNYLPTTCTLRRNGKAVIDGEGGGDWMYTQHMPSVVRVPVVKGTAIRRYARRAV